MRHWTVFCRIRQAPCRNPQSRPGIRGFAQAKPAFGILPKRSRRCRLPRTSCDLSVRRHTELNPGTPHDGAPGPRTARTTCRLPETVLKRPGNTAVIAEGNSLDEPAACRIRQSWRRTPLPVRPSRSLRYVTGWIRAHEATVGNSYFAMSITGTAARLWVQHHLEGVLREGLFKRTGCARKSTEYGQRGTAARLKRCVG